MVPSPIERSQAKSIPSDCGWESIETTPQCHTDTAWLKDTQITGGGWILRDHNDQILFQGKRTMTHIRLPLMDEAIAIREALLHAARLMMNQF